jgi:two-component sensor histidine kinase
MDALVRTVLQPYDSGSPDRIVLSAPNVLVGAKAVTSLALVLHKTATNAVKYGALSRPEGSVHVKWIASGDDLCLEWDENGGPEIVIAPKMRGFCTTLVDRSVTGAKKEFASKT